MQLGIIGVGCLDKVSFHKSEADNDQNTLIHNGRGYSKQSWGRKSGPHSCQIQLAPCSELHICPLTAAPGLAIKGHSVHQQNHQMEGFAKTCGLFSPEIELRHLLLTVFLPKHVHQANVYGRTCLPCHPPISVPSPPCSPPFSQTHGPCSPGQPLGTPTFTDSSFPFRVPCIIIHALNRSSCSD